MAKTAGSIWVDTQTLHYIDQFGQEWYFTGTAGSSPSGAVVGSIWVSGNVLHYISSTGVDRSVPASSIATRAGSVSGSMWVETSAANNFCLAYINNSTTEYRAHDDVAHVDDAPHTDIHGDGHDDGHSDIHFDVAHDDIIEYYQDFPLPPSGHIDQFHPHEDVAHDDFYSDTHTDLHDDSHTDTTGHSDAPHTDQPTFVP